MRIFPKISNQKMNDYLKELAEIAKLDAPFLKTKFVGTNRHFKSYPKYQILSSHAARRTFAVLSLEQGMRMEVLHKILGHKDIRTTLKYVTILDEIKHDEMNSAWDDFDD